MALIGDDCIYYFTSGCKKGDRCQYRHCEEALDSYVVCPSWLDGGCYLPHCPYRHAHIEPEPDEYDHYGEHSGPVQGVGSSLISVPIVGGVEPPTDRRAPVLAVDQYGIAEKYGMPDQYGIPDQYGMPDRQFQYGSMSGPAPVIISQRRDELFPPVVQPVVVHLGASESDDSDDSEPVHGNLTTIRPVDIDENSTDVAEKPRVVVQKDRVEDLPEDVVEEQEEAEEEEEEEREDQDVGEQAAGGEEESAEEEEEGGAGSEQEEAVEDEEEAGRNEESAGEESSSEESKGSNSVADGAGSPGHGGEGEPGEPVLDLFDEDAETFLGEVERTPLQKKKERRKSQNRQSDPARRREERREKRRQDRGKDRSAAAASKDTGTAAAAAAKASPRKPDNNDTNKQSAEENKEPVEVMSLEDIMRQKALQSMIERRKQKEEAEKAKQGGGTEAKDEANKSLSPDPLRRDSPRRFRRDRRRSAERDDRSYGRQRSPGRLWYEQRRSRSPLDMRRRQRRRSIDYDDGDRWRRRDDYDYDASERLRSSEGSRTLDLIQAQSKLLAQMARLASGPSEMLSEKELKRQRKLLKRQLRDLTKKTSKRPSSESEYESSSSSFGSSDSSPVRRSKHKKKSKKSKKEKKSRRKAVEEFDEKAQKSPSIHEEEIEEEEEEEDFAKYPVPRAKMVIKVDDESSRELTVSPATEVLLESKAEESELLEPVKVIPGRKIQLKKTVTAGRKDPGSMVKDSGVGARIGARVGVGVGARVGALVVDDEEMARRQSAIASRAAAKKTDDEAAKLMLQKIREKAQLDKKGRARMVSGEQRVSAAVKQVKAADETEVADTGEAAVRKPVILQPARIIQMAGLIKPGADSTDTAGGEEEGSGAPLKTLKSGRRIVLGDGGGRTSGAPPGGKRSVMSRLDQVRSAKAAITRSLTPEPRVASPTLASDTSVTAPTTAASRITRPAKTQETSASAKRTNFELGVKTFAEIMREKRERRARELEEKKRSSEMSPAAGEQAAAGKPKINRPSVMERLSLPKSETIGTTKPTSSVAPLSAGRRTIQQYDDDWLDEPSPQECLVRDTKRAARSAQSETSPPKRARTEPSPAGSRGNGIARPANSNVSINEAISFNSESKAQISKPQKPDVPKPEKEVVTSSRGKPEEEVVTLSTGTPETEVVSSSRDVKDSRREENRSTASAVSEDTRRTSADGAKSTLEELDLLLGDVGVEESITDPVDDDDELFNELDQLLM